ncbi:MAG: hypothetical protein ACK56I_31815, partial [bacterium]
LRLSVRQRRHHTVFGQVPQGRGKAPLLREPHHPAPGGRPHRLRRPVRRAEGAPPGVLWPN